MKLREKINDIILSYCEGHYHLEFTEDDFPNILNEIEETINYSRCSTQLKEFDSDNFEDWLIINGYTCFKNFYLKGDISFTESELMQKYNDEVMNL